jgi:hypothetical protein
MSEVAKQRSETELNAKLAPGEAQEVLPLEAGDFYMDGPYMVFTEAYHLRRGYCCNSGCRHCPYK